MSGRFATGAPGGTCRMRLRRCPPEVSRTVWSPGPSGPWVATGGSGPAADDEALLHAPSARAVTSSGTATATRRNAPLGTVDPHERGDERVHPAKPLVVRSGPEDREHVA